MQKTLIYILIKKRLRRIEKLYNKGKYLKLTRTLIQNFLKKIFKKKFCIFKDKYNCKPPKGEGFFLIMMAYFILKIKKQIKERLV